MVPVSPGFYFVSSEKHDLSFKYSVVYFYAGNQPMDVNGKTRSALVFAKLLLFFSCYRRRYFDGTISSILVLHAIDGLKLSS